MNGKLKRKRHRWSAWLLLLFSNILDKIIKICINLVLTAGINLHQAMNFGNSDMIINWQYVVIEKILRKKGNNTCTYVFAYLYWGIKQLWIITLLQFRICLLFVIMNSTVKCQREQKREHTGKLKHLNHCTKVHTTLFKCEDTGCLKWNTFEAKYKVLYNNSNA